MVGLPPPAKVDRRARRTPPSAPAPAAGGRIVTSPHAAIGRPAQLLIARHTDERGIDPRQTGTGPAAGHKKISKFLPPIRPSATRVAECAKTLPLTNCARAIRAATESKRACRTFTSRAMDMDAAMTVRRNQRVAQDAGFVNDFESRALTPREFQPQLLPQWQPVRATDT